MKTKFDVGQEVGFKGKVVNINISPSRITYKVYVDGHGDLTFNEDELSDVLDLSDMEK